MEHMKQRTSKITLSRQSDSLCEIVATCVKMFQFQASQKGLMLSWKTAPGVPEWALIDRNRVQQMLCKLVSNAIKFTEQGSVEVCMFLALQDLHLGRIVRSIRGIFFLTFLPLLYIPQK